MSDFIFNGISAASLGLGIERYPAIPMPRKKVTALSIPGRSGELHIDEGGLENVTVRYEVWWKNDKADNFNTSVHAREVTRWLYGAPVGARLEDTYNPGVFRTATFLGGVDIEDIMGRFGRVVLEFSCSPQKWLTGVHDEGQTFTNGLTEIDGIIYNPTPYPTKPLIRIIGSVGGLLQIGAGYMLLRWPGTGETHEFWLDCEEEEAWEIVDGQEVSTNAYIDAVHFLEIQPGRSEVKFPGGWESVTVWTRAYEL